MTACDSLVQLRDALRHFATEREWEPFHTPGNLAMSLMIEAAELGEHFQWERAPTADAMTETRREAIALEMADVLLYLVRLADTLQVDLVEAARRKMDLNARRYPVEASRGRAGRPEST